MTPETIVHRNISIWPFESFRSFGPMFEESWPLTAWTPLCDIYETDTDIVLKMELPEMPKEDVHVTLENNVLTVHGERKFEEAVNREKYYRIERMYGEFTRIFTLPTFVEGSSVLAEFSQGMLTVTLPKKVAAIPRQIEVKLI